MKLSVIGIDVGKNVLHVHGADAQGKSVLRKTFGRGALVEWLAQQAPCLIGMEACGGAHHLARVLIDCGHTVRLIHPSFVKAYVKSNKNDFRDAEAIAEAVTRPTMRFVAIKTVAQQELQALHRLRSGAVTQRTAVINQLRGLLLEFGITVPRGPTALRRHLPEILEKVDGGVAALGRDLVAELQQEWVHLDERIAALEQRLRQQTRTSEPCRRLQTMPRHRGARGVRLRGRLRRRAPVGQRPRLRGRPRLSPLPAQHRWPVATWRHQQTGRSLPPGLVHPRRAGCVALRRPTRRLP